MPAGVPRSRTRTRRDQAERLSIKRRAALGCPEAAVRQRQVMADSRQPASRPEWPLPRHCSHWWRQLDRQQGVELRPSTIRLTAVGKSHLPRDHWRESKAGGVHLATRRRRFPMPSFSPSVHGPTSFVPTASADHSTSASTPCAVAAVSLGCRHARLLRPNDAPAQARWRRAIPSHAPE